MTYLISYTMYDNLGRVIKSGEMKVHRRKDEFDAKTSLDKYLQSKYPRMARLVIHRCEFDVSDNPFSFFNDIWGK